ncbi:hypothetical protein DPMN_156512 [Dreissena polymorpha]|uniref:B box-type domain-containing protein n=1 Tax=Dreissena polymorpha TaxID=45954 RepID=A0A9D4JCF6_DREPO|nr:hypothetical protein DPMN_156512 [Dreissena polymorpha]
MNHFVIKVSKHHTLCDIADELLKSLLACPNHEKEEVAYLCKDHDMTCCNKCAMADHRKCEEVKQKLLDIYAQLENEVLSSIADKKKVMGEKIETNNDKARQFLNDIKQQSTYIELVEKFGTNEHVVLLQRRLEKNSVNWRKVEANLALNVLRIPLLIDC